MADLEELPFQLSQLKQLNDTHWRRLGITQTFERLVVEAVATQPAPPPAIKARVGEGFNQSAVKFWELSFGQLLQDMLRREQLRVQGGDLRLGEKLQGNLRRILSELERAVSFVQPTSGLTMAQIDEQMHQREQQAKEKAAQARAAAKERAAQRAAQPAEKPAGAVRRRVAVEGAATKKRAPAPIAAPHSAPSAAPAASAPEDHTKLFTTLRLNRLLDALSSGRMLKADIGRRMELSGAQLERFLEATSALDLTRTAADNLTVDLHWEGQSLARTQTIDRRIALQDIVQRLRAHVLEAQG